MSISSIKALAELVGEPEIIPLLDGCGEHTLVEVEDLLHSLVAAQGHPSQAYKARVRAGLMNDIWDRVYGFDQGDYMRWLILERVEHWTRTKGLHDINRELRIAANLWDASGSKEDLDEECDAVEYWDHTFLNETYFYPAPSPEAVMNTAGRAVYYALNGNMSGTVSARDAAEYFGWRI